MAEQRDDLLIALRYALLKKGTKQKFSLFFLIIVSVLVIILDKLSYSYITKTRAVLNDFIYQVAIVTSSPEKFTKYLIDRGIHHYSVYDENNLLKEQNAELKAQLVNNQFLKTENEMLKEALKLSSNRHQFWSINQSIKY